MTFVFLRFCELDSFTVQLLLSAGKVSGGEFWPGQQTAGEGVFNIRHFFLARRVQYEVYDLLRQIQGARMADTQPQAPEIGGAELGLNILQAVVAAVAAALLEADAAGWQIEFVMDDENLGRWNLVKIGQRRHRLAGAVHESGRLQQPKLATTGRLAKKLGLQGERGLQLVSQLVDEPETDIVPGGGIFLARITEADDEARWIHGWKNEMAAGGKMPAAANAARGRKLRGGSFAFSGSSAAVLGNDADQDRVIGAMLNQFDTGRQRELGGVDVVADIHRAEVDR
jgi:hypothetical protein